MRMLYQVIPYITDSNRFELVEAWQVLFAVLKNVPDAMCCVIEGLQEHP